MSIRHLTTSPLDLPAAAAILFLAAGLSNGPPAARAQGHAHDEPPTSPQATEDPDFESLLRQRKFDEVILKADELRAHRKGGDPEAEYWAARALRFKDDHEGSRERLQALARNHPKHERGRAAAIESSVVFLYQIEGDADTDAERDLARRAARELEATAANFQSQPDLASRALYIAGNAWRMAGHDSEAAADYEACRRLESDTEYQAKCTYMLGILAERALRPDDARELHADCVKSWPDTSTARRCRKALESLDVVGAPAPPLQVETWLKEGPLEDPELRGKVVMIFFFATWCPHCKQALPGMVDYLERFEGRPFELIAMTNNTKGQTTEAARLFVADPQWNLTYPTAVDDRGRTSEALGTTGVPAVTLIDKAGIVRFVGHPNYLTDAMIERLLAE